MNGLFALLKQYELQKIHYHVHSSQEMGFPINDAYCISRNDQTIIIVNVLGLLGVNSPLPTYLINNQNIRWQDFIQLFNERFYQLFYLLWKQYHPIHETLENDRYKKIIVSLMNDRENSYFPFARYFVKKNYSSRDLGIMIKTLIPESEIIVQENLPFWQPIAFLDNEYQLGNNTMLGEECLTVDSKIQITLSITDIAVAKKLILRASLYQMLTYVIRLFTKTSCRVDLYLRVLLNQSRIPRLSESMLDLHGLQTVGIILGQWYCYDLGSIDGAIGKRDK